SPSSCITPRQPPDCVRSAAFAYAAVAHLDTSDPRWRRCWRALHLAATGIVAATQEATEPAAGHPPSRALVSRRSATPPTLRRLAAPLSRWCGADQRRSGPRQGGMRRRKGLPRWLDRLHLGLSGREHRSGWQTARNRGIPLLDSRPGL